MNVISTLLLLELLVGADLPADFSLSPPPGKHVYDIRRLGRQPDGSYRSTKHGPLPLVAEAPRKRTANGAITDERSAESLPTFRSGQPVIATSYFYWYDIESNSHVINHDGTDALTDHPPTTAGFSYNNTTWHQRQLEDMIAAGIDVALPVYWGTPLGDFGFSNAGLPKLVAARQRLLDAGKRPPAIGMFYDTSTLRHNRKQYHVDLTTPAGRLWFYGTIRDCFSLIPPEHRAHIDGRPLVLLYASAFAKAVDAQLFPAVRAMFRKDFGTDLFLVKMVGWPGEADSQYQWGGALRPQLLETAGIGPGYDHSAVPGRSPLVRTRDDGRFYQFAWNRLLAMDPKTRPSPVHVETWNEFHEGTEICETVEYGRQYIDLTRRFADRFHAGQQIDLSSLGPVLKTVSATPEKADGITLVPMPDGDGPVVEKTVDGKKAWCTTENRHSPTTRYLYFEVSDYFVYDGDQSLEVTIIYHDGGPAEFTIHYDSNDPSVTGLAQAFRSGPTTPIHNTDVWKEVTFTIPHARFIGRANGADLRLACVHEDLVIGGITLSR